MYAFCQKNCLTAKGATFTKIYIIHIKIILCVLRDLCGFMLI